MQLLKRTQNIHERRCESSRLMFVLVQRVGRRAHGPDAVACLQLRGTRVFFNIKKIQASVTYQENNELQKLLIQAKQALI